MAITDFADDKMVAIQLILVFLEWWSLASIGSCSSDIAGVGSGMDKAPFSVPPQQPGPPPTLPCLVVASC